MRKESTNRRAEFNPSKKNRIKAAKGTIVNPLGSRCGSRLSPRPLRFLTVCASLDEPAGLIREMIPGQIDVQNPGTGWQAAFPGDPESPDDSIPFLSSPDSQLHGYSNIYSRY